MCEYDQALSVCELLCGLRSSTQASHCNIAWVQVGQLSQVGQPVHRPNNFGVAEVPVATQSAATQSVTRTTAPLFCSF